MSNQVNLAVTVQQLHFFVRSSAREHGLILTQHEREALADMARDGHQHAREDLIRALYRFCEKRAYRYNEMFFCRAGSFYEDIYQEGVAAGVAALDQALGKYADPMPYLFRAAANEMVEFCVFRNHLIRIPETRKNESAAHAPHQVKYLSAFTENELETLFPEEYRPVEQGTQMHQKLYAAVDRLRGRYKTVVEMRFGLNGQPVSSLETVSLHISGGKTKGMAGSYQSQALRKLRGALLQEGIQ